MKIFLFVLVPVLVVTAYALYQWARTRQPSSVESGVDAFRREMAALSPERAPINRRPERAELAYLPDDEPDEELERPGPSGGASAAPDRGPRAPDPGAGPAEGWEPPRRGPRRPGAGDPSGPDER